MTEQLEAILSEGLTRLSIPFTDETLHQFRIYYALLSERSQQMNLTAISGRKKDSRRRERGRFSGSGIEDYQP